jgi:hypothetical protein
MKERLKAWRQIVSMNTAMEDTARFYGKMNSMSGYYIDRHETSIENIREGDRKNPPPERFERRKDAKPVGTYENPEIRRDGRRVRPLRPNPMIKERGATYVKKYKSKMGLPMTKTMKRPQYVRYGEAEVLEQTGEPRRYPAVPYEWTGRWKASFDKVLRSLEGTIKKDKDGTPVKNYKGEYIPDKPYIFGDWYSYQKETSDKVNMLREAINDNDEILEDLGYDGRYTLPTRRVWRPQWFWWERDTEKEKAKEDELKNYEETVPMLKEAIKNGTAPKSWWKAFNMTQHY